MSVESLPPFGDSEPYALPVAETTPSPARRLLSVLWPAFLMAAVLEMLVFAWVDPERLQDGAGEPLALSRSAIYSIAFILFWAAIATSAAITRWLDAPGPAPRVD